MTIQMETTIRRTTVYTTILAMRTPLTTPLMISTLVTASTQGTQWMILLGWIILTPVLEALIIRTTEVIRLTMGHGLITEETPGVTTVVVVGATVGSRGLAISLFRH